MRFTTAAIAVELERIQAEADRATDALAERVRVEIIAPICERHGLEFISGMGSYSFADRGAGYFSTGRHFPNSQECPGYLRCALTILELSTFDRFDLGHAVGDVCLDAAGKAI